MAQNHTNGTNSNLLKGRTNYFEYFILFIFSLVLIFTMATIIVRMLMLREAHDTISRLNSSGQTTEESSPEEILDAAEVALIRAQDALGSVELILSFLEGASVLVAVGAGAAAIYGFRSTRELREDLDEEIHNLRDLREKIQPYEGILSGLETTLDGYEQRSLNMLPNFNDLLRSTVELNLKNYSVAHYYAKKVWENSPQNTQALYIAGWLELQYIEGQLNPGVEKLALAYRLDPDSPSIQAAYGVGLRRQAREFPDHSEERRIHLMLALTHLRAATHKSEGLLDLNRESFWGPIGGTERDLGNLQDALDAYERANQITPNSSYPLGNMAELYLALRQQNASYMDNAIWCFQQTIKLAIRELGSSYDDYYPNMDLAMSHTMLGEVENNELDHFEESKVYFERALAMDGVTSKMLEVSLGGWRRLQSVCPDEWNAVEKSISRSITRLESQINAIKREHQADNK